MYQIILSSTNFAKKEAVKRFFSDQKIDFELFCFDVDSGVVRTPESDEDGIIGSQNRIKNAKITWQNWQAKNLTNSVKKKDEDTSDKLIFIGMEGILNRNKFGTFLGGWVCLEINGQCFLGSSARCQLPTKITENCGTFKELSDITKSIYPQKASLIDKIGTNGVLTNGLYTRIDEFEDALRCSWGIFMGTNNSKNV